MKAYRIQGKYSQAVFYVGYCKDVEPTLSSFFSKYADGVKPSKKDAKDKPSPQPPKPTQHQPQSHSSSSPTSQSSQPPTKHLSLHILLYDLPLTQYNYFKSHTQQKFSHQISQFHDPLVMHIAMVDSRQESLKYIKKIQKYTQAEFQQNLLQLNQELQQNAEYDLIKAYLGEKFGISREEVFEWMQATKIKTFKQLLGFKDIPNYQKKELRQLLNNLTLLEELYEGEAQNDDSDE